jgi:hypothetical protein
MAVSLKIFKVSFGEKKIKFKLASNAPGTEIDKLFRDTFDISSEVEYSLIDMKDNTIIDVSSVCYLDEESSICIKSRTINGSSRNESASAV